MRPIPPELRKKLEADLWMKKCCYTGETKDITWEHCWIYGGKQINEWWAIVPLVRRLNTANMPTEIKNFCRWISLIRAKPEDLAKYPKKNWGQEKKYLDDLFLNKKYAVSIPRSTAIRKPNLQERKRNNNLPKPKS